MIGILTCPLVGPSRLPGVISAAVAVLATVLTLDITLVLSELFMGLWDMALNRLSQAPPLLLSHGMDMDNDNEGTFPFPCAVNADGSQGEVRSLTMYVASPLFRNNELTS